MGQTLYKIGRQRATCTCTSLPRLRTQSLRTSIFDVKKVRKLRPIFKENRFILWNVEIIRKETKYKAEQLETWYLRQFCVPGWISAGQADVCDKHFMTGCCWTHNGRFNHSNKLEKLILRLSIDGAALILFPKNIKNHLYIQYLASDSKVWNKCDFFQ